MIYIWLRSDFHSPHVDWSEGWGASLALAREYKPMSSMEEYYHGFVPLLF